MPLACVRCYKSHCQGTTGFPRKGTHEEFVANA